MKETRTLKSLNSQLRIMEGEAEALKIQMANKQREFSQKLTAIKNLKEEIAKYNKIPKLRVSEHAIIRYFERVKSADIKAIEKDILSEDILFLANKFGGSGTFPNGSYSVVMDNFTVTTVVT